MLYIDKGYLLEICGELMDGHISYAMGAKAPSLNFPPSKISSIDCSGFTRYLIHRVTDGQVTLPDGSDEQDAWCKKRDLRSQSYMNDARMIDGNLRIAFIPRHYHKGKVDKAGHVWLVVDGRTLESHGHKGPSRRDWSDHHLKSGVHSCYVLAHLYQMSAGAI